MEIVDYSDSNKDPEETQRIVKVIQSRLQEHNRSQYPEPKTGQIVVAVHGEGQEVLAGLVCDVAYGWLTIEFLWVDADHRGQGLGSRLLETGEREGKARGCHGAHLTTYTFQAPEFYERHGYERFADLGHYPGDQSLVFLSKKL